jgi:hypothetical protein
VCHLVCSLVWIIWLKTPCLCSLNKVYLDFNCLEIEIPICENWMPTCSFRHIVTIVWVMVYIASGVSIRIIGNINIETTTKCWAVWWVAVYRFVVILDDRVLGLFVNWKYERLSVVFVTIAWVPADCGETSENVPQGRLDQAQGRSLAVTQAVELGTCETYIWVSCSVEPSNFISYPSLKKVAHK